MDSQCTGIMSVAVDEARVQVLRKASNGYITSKASLEVVLVEKVFQLFVESIAHADRNPLLRVAPEGDEQKEFASALQGKAVAGQDPQSSAGEEQAAKEGRKEAEAENSRSVGRNDSGTSTEDLQRSSQDSLRSLREGPQRLLLPLERDVGTTRTRRALR